MTIREEGVGEREEEVADPLDYVARLQQEFRAPRLEQLPVFTGGLVGYFGYEIVQRFEPRLADGDKPDELGTPDMVLLLSEEVAVFDNLAGRLYLIVNVDPSLPDAWAAAQRRLDKLAHRLRCGSLGYGEAVSRAPVGRSGLPLRFQPRAISSLRWTGARNTSWPATSSRWCCPSA